jgi:uncharacterized membrane protein YtjA (UPF0391 family)
MPQYTIGFLVVAVIAGLSDFTGLRADAANIARSLFFLFTLLFAASLVTGVLRER